MKVRPFGPLFAIFLAVALLEPNHSSRAQVPQLGKRSSAGAQDRLKALKGEVAARKLTFEVGHTSVSDKDLDLITGLKPPPLDYLTKQVAHQNDVARAILKLEREVVEAFDKLAAAAGRPKLPETVLRASLPSPAAASFDWTKLGKVSPVQFQGYDCGSCWAFASVAALESSILIRANKSIDLSEQYVLDNVVWGNCQHGGWTAEAFTQMMLLGTAKESDCPYQGKKAGARLIMDNPYRALIWGFVGDGIMPSVPELKVALLLHGPLTVCIRATDLLQNYKTGVFNEHAKGQTNHVVCLVGWDEGKKAWRIKNSWGADWGENGFGWIAYGSNGIGFGSAWVESLNLLLQLPPELLAWLNKAKKLAQDSERELKAAAEKAERALAEAEAAADRAKSQADKAAKEAAEKAREAAEKARIAAEKQREIATAKNAAEKKAKEAAAKAAREASERAHAEAERAKKVADRAAQEAEDKVKSAAKAVAGHLPALPDPTKHLPHF